MWGYCFLRLTRRFSFSFLSLTQRHTRHTRDTHREIHTERHIRRETHTCRETHTHRDTHTERCSQSPILRLLLISVMVCFAMFCSRSPLSRSLSRLFDSNFVISGTASHTFILQINLAHVSHTHVTNKSHADLSHTPRL